MTTTIASPNSSDFRLATKGGKPRVDMSENVIWGARMMQEGDLNDDRPWKVDEFSLRQAHALGSRSRRGMKARFTHPGASDDALGSFLGYWQNLQIKNGVLFGDLFISDRAFDTPRGDLGSYVLGMAQDHPETFGVSLATKLDLEAMDDEQIDGELTPLRFEKIVAGDIVDEPAATRGGLFSTDNGHDTRSLPHLVEWILDHHFSEANPDDVVDRFMMFLRRYYGEDATQGVFAMTQTADKQSVAPADGKSFLDAFGDRGARWFVEGKSFEECSTLFQQELQTSNADLRERLDAANQLLKEKDEQIADLQSKLDKIQQLGDDPVGGSAPADPDNAEPKKHSLSDVTRIVGRTPADVRK